MFATYFGLLNQSLGPHKSVWLAMPVHICCEYCAFASHEAVSCESASYLPVRN